jgi:hypothetical protein
MKYVTPKHRLTVNGLHGVIPQKIELLKIVKWLERNVGKYTEEEM